MELAAEPTGMFAVMARMRVQVLLMLQRLDERFTELFGNLAATVLIWAAVCLDPHAYRHGVADSQAEHGMRQSKDGEPVLMSAGARVRDLGRSRRGRGALLVGVHTYGLLDREAMLGVPEFLRDRRC